MVSPGSGEKCAKSYRINNRAEKGWGGGSLQMNANSTNTPHQHHHCTPPPTTLFTYWCVLQSTSMARAILWEEKMFKQGNGRERERDIGRVGKRERERERERESKNEGKSEMGVPYYFFTKAQPLLSLAPPLISLLELICKSMAVAVGPAALSRSVPVISGSSSPSTPHTLDASLPDN